MVPAGESARPLGSTPDCTLQVAEPTTLSRVEEYADPTRPTGRISVVIDGTRPASPRTRSVCGVEPPKLPPWCRTILPLPKAMSVHP